MKKAKPKSKGVPDDLERVWCFIESLGYVVFGATEKTGEQVTEWRFGVLPMRDTDDMLKRGPIKKKKRQQRKGSKK